VGIIYRFESMVRTFFGRFLYPELFKKLKSYHFRRVSVMGKRSRKLAIVLVFTLRFDGKKELIKIVRVHYAEDLQAKAKAVSLIFEAKEEGEKIFKLVEEKIKK
jgi:hypothetical protein